MASNPPKPITFELTENQLDQIKSYTDKPTVNLQARIVDGKLVLERVEVDGKLLQLNRHTKRPRG